MSDDASAPVTQAPNGRMVWIDLEMTGLDPQTDEVVEIAVVVTEADLTEIDEGLSEMMDDDGAFLDEDAGPFVDEMDGGGGLEMTPLEQAPVAPPPPDAPPARDRVPDADGRIGW